MGPSVRSIIQRIQAGERVPSTQSRAAVMMLSECYERVMMIMLDGQTDGDVVDTKYMAILNAIVRNERTLQDDLSPAYSAIRLAKTIGEISPSST